MKTKVFSLSLLILLLVACGAKKSNIVAHPLYSLEVFDINGFSSDGNYGFTEENAVKVGGSKRMEGPRNERRFLNALAGPNGEQIQYYRIGSCCSFKTSNGINGVGFLDAYQVFYLKSPGDTVKNTIYINMYDTDAIFVPVGFTKKYND